MGNFLLFPNFLHSVYQTWPHLSKMVAKVRKKENGKLFLNCIKQLFCFYGKVKFILNYSESVYPLIEVTFVLI